MAEPGRGRVWLVVGLLATGALVATAGPLADVLFAEERTEGFDVPGPVTAVDVETRNGAIELVPGATARVEARERWALREPDVEVELTDGVLRVRDGCPAAGWPLGSCQVTLRVTVPAEAPARLRSTNGALRFDGWTGEIDAATTNGTVAGDGLEATAVAARTTNGEVDLRFVTAPDVVDARTVNGGVTVAVPEATYAVDAATTNGRVRVDVAEDGASPRRIAARSVNGPVSVIGS